MSHAPIRCLMQSRIIHLDFTAAITRWWSRINYEYRWGFFAGLCAAISAHGFLFSNLIINEDSHYICPDLYVYWKSGRWLMGYFIQWREGITLPLPICAMSLLLLVLAGCVNAAIWKARSRWTVAALCSVYAVYPAFASAFSYQYIADIYPAACLLSVLAVYLTCRRGWAALLLGALSLILSLAIYQAFLSMTAAICLFLLVMNLAGGRHPGRVGRCALRFLTLGAVAMGGYFLSIKLLLRLHEGEKLFNYRGIDEIGPLQAGRIPLLLARTYQAFDDLLAGVYFFVPGYVRWSILAILVLGVCTVLIKTICRPTDFATKLTVLAFVLGMLIIAPPVAFLTSIGAGATPIDILLSFGMIVVLAAAICVLLESHLKLLRSLSLIAIAAMLAGFVIRSNAIHLKSYLYTKSTFLTANRVMARVEALREFNERSRLALVGRLPNPNIVLNREPPFNELSRGYYDGPVGFSDTRSDQASKKIANVWGMLGYRIGYVWAHEVPFVREKAAEMPIWPAPGSVRAFGDLIVVNFGFDRFIKIVNVQKTGPNQYRFTTRMYEEDRDWEYAWYVHRDNKIVEKIWYGQDNELEYTFSVPGTYKVLAYARSRDKKSSGFAFSPEVKITSPPAK